MSKAFDEKIKPQSLVDVVTERLAEAIVEGTLVPGSRLSEQALAASMGVSRGPLREAIRRLEGRRRAGEQVMAVEREAAQARAVARQALDLPGPGACFDAIVLRSSEPLHIGSTLLHAGRR